MRDEEVIDSVLMIALKEEPNCKRLTEFIQELKIPEKQRVSTFEKMKDDLLLTVDQSGIVQLTTKGRDIANNEGYLSHMEIVKRSIKHDEELARLEFEKLKYDHQLSKLQFNDYKRTRLIAWIGAGLSFVLGIIELVRIIIHNN